MIISPVAVNCEKCTPILNAFFYWQEQRFFFYQAEKTFHWHLGAHFLTWTHDSTSCITQTFSPAISISTLVSWPLASLKKKSNTFSVTEKRIYNHGSKGITTKITHTWILSNDMITGNYVLLPLNPTQTQPFPMEYNNEKWKMYKAILCLLRHKWIL